MTHAPIGAKSSLAEALEQADLRVLLMCLVHLTGTTAWLEPPYQPHRDVRLVPDPNAGFDAGTAARIRDAVAQALHDDQRPMLTDPGDALLSRMMNVCLGEVVPAEYLPMVRADMGFDDAWPNWRPGSSTPPMPGSPDVDTPVLIIGAGLSGMCLAVRLTALGIPFLIVEKNNGVGGTWFENRYPGCGVDTPNHFYSYSFAPNPSWERFFSPQPEILRYLQGFADQHDLHTYIRFGTTVRSMAWDDAAKHWTVSLDSLDTSHGSTQVRAACVVSAIGHFNKPVVPQFPGQDEFAGEIFHSARWPDGLDLTGKDVAVIGTGASSMQLVPTIAESVRTLTIFQRSAQWARHVPGLNDPVRPSEQYLFTHLPYYGTWTRFTQFWRYGDGLLRFLKKDPDWPHPQRSLNRINDRHRQEMTDYITAELAARPDLLDKCIPTYPPYGKRILLDKGWYRAIQRSNVDLVTEPIERLTADGIVDASGALHRADVVVVATGFSVTDLAARLNVSGIDGRALADDWADDNPHAHLGITVPGFPNFFMMGGPNTNAGHGGSAYLVAESQTRYITSCLVTLVESGHRSVDVRPSVRDAYIAEVDAEHETLIWTHPGMSTYYRNKADRVVSPMPFRLVDYWHSTRSMDTDDFEWS